MKELQIFAFAFAVLLAAGLCVSAKPTTFKNSGLKTETVVTLDVTGKRVTGTFASSEYDENAVKNTFTGEVVPTPKGKSGVYMEIHFSAKVPYSPSPQAKALRWSLRLVNHRAHLFIPMWEQDYTGKTPKWVVSDVEFAPED
jgi:hypothetical protein